MRWLLTLCVLTGAGHAARAADCLDRSAEASRGEAADGAVTMCFDADVCWVFDVGARTWARHAPHKIASHDLPRPPEPKTTAHIRVCAPDGTDCHAIDLPDAQTFGNLDVIQTPDRARVAILGQGSSAYLYDGPTQKLVATIRPWKSKYDGDVLQEGYFIEGNLALYESASPITEEVRLFDGATGKPIAIVDSSIIGEPIELSGGDWAFWHIETSTFVVVNGRTGKHGASIPLVAPGVKDVGDGAALATHRTTDGKLFLAAVGDAASGVVVYDLATKKQTRYLPPLCKK